MKYFMFFAIFLAFISCKKEETPSEVLMEMEMTGAKRTHTGMFVNGPSGTVTGSAHIVRNTD